MRELNKFQIVTVIFLLMFVFVVGAIYTNTKDAVEQKMRTTNYNQNSNYSETKSISSSEISDFNKRITVLEEKVANSENTQKPVSSLKCHIQGVMDGDEVVQLSGEEAFREAESKNRELVLLCNF